MIFHLVLSHMFLAAQDSGELLKGLTAIGRGLAYRQAKAELPRLEVTVSHPPMRSNPSIERTCPGKPGHASHVKP